MNRENLKNIVRLVNETINKKITENKLIVYAGSDLVFSKMGDFSESEIVDVLKKHMSYRKDDYWVDYDGMRYKIDNNFKIYKRISSDNWKLINESKKLTESSVPPFQNNREAIFAIDDVMDGSMTQKNFINRLAASKRSGTIDQKNFELLLGELRMKARHAGVKLEQIIDRLIDKYHPGSDTFNPNLGESKKIANYDKYKKIFDNKVDELLKKGVQVQDGRGGNMTFKSGKSKTGSSSHLSREEAEKLAHSKLLQSGDIPGGTTVKDFTMSTNEAKKLTEAPIPGQIIPQRPIASASAPIAKQPQAVAPAPVAVPQPAGIDPAWKLDMVEFLGNSFAGMAKQFLYQAKKSNTQSTPDQIAALANELQSTGQISELFKTRFLTALSAAV